MEKSRWQFYERAQREVYRKLKAREKPEAVVGGGFHTKGGRAGFGKAPINLGPDLYSGYRRFANEPALQGLWDEESIQEGMEPRR